MRKCAGLVLAQGSSHRTVRQRSSSCVAEGGKRLTRCSERRLARRRSGCRAGHWWPWASWDPVCAAHGIPYCRNGRGREKQKLANDLGAHVYIDTSVDDAVAVLQRMGGARAILATGTSGNAMGSLVSGLAARGKLIVDGVPQDQMQLSERHL
jgi:hypothetical protein